MTEKILTNKKHGMAMLIFFLLLMAAAIVMVVIGAMRNIIALILPGIVILCFIWIPMMGLKILKPQEALVLTLFGHYYGTLKGEGYYYVNPFCTGLSCAWCRMFPFSVSRNLQSQSWCSFSVEVSIIYISPLSTKRSNTMGTPPNEMALKPVSVVI